MQKPMLFLRAALSLGAIMMISPADAGTRSFGGYPCKHGCKAYARGYRWAEREKVTDPNRCQIANSVAFRAGCMVYTQDPSRGADHDDNGRWIRL
jgi:hypothetical protein